MISSCSVLRVSGKSIRIAIAMESSLRVIRTMESSGLNPTRKGMAESKSYGDVSVVMGEASRREIQRWLNAKNLLITKGCRLFGRDAL